MSIPVYLNLNSKKYYISKRLWYIDIYNYNINLSKIYFVLEVAKNFSILKWILMKIYESLSKYLKKYQHCIFFSWFLKILCKLMLISKLEKFRYLKSLIFWHLNVLQIELSESLPGNRCNRNIVWFWYIFVYTYASTIQNVRCTSYELHPPRRINAQYSLLKIAGSYKLALLAFQACICKQRR